MHPETVIKIENLSKSYKMYSSSVARMKEALHPFKRQYHHDFYALNDVSFEIKRGETFGIIGKNGAGKSTLLKIISGVLTPTKGRVQVNGRISALLELGAGFNVEYTGLENIFFQGSLMGLTRRQMSARLDDILAFADIGDFVHQKVKTYSSGMFARLAFAIAIHVEPDILIVDEALAVGDLNFQLKCHQRMDQLRAHGVTVLFVSHDTYSVKTLCSRAIFLHQGQQKTYGHALDVVNDYLLFLDKDQQKNTPVELPNERITPRRLASIEQVNVLNHQSDLGVVLCKTKDSLLIEVAYHINSPNIDAVVLVFNLYRERDNVYVCGTTTLMDGLAPIPVSPGAHRFQLHLKSLPLLCGKYRLRVAINEKKGLGIIAETVDALMLELVDHHEAEGLMTIEREWIL